MFSLYPSHSAHGTLTSTQVIHSHSSSHASIIHHHLGLVVAGGSRHFSCWQRFPAPPWGFQGSPSSDGICNPSGEFWVCLRVSFQLDIPWELSNIGAWKAFWSDALATSASSFQREGPLDVQSPSFGHYGVEEVCKKDWLVNRDTCLFNTTIYITADRSICSSLLSVGNRKVSRGCCGSPCEHQMWHFVNIGRQFGPHSDANIWC